LDAADLFVGLLWRRWGEPTGSAGFSSGFEEEFERATSRRARSRAPEMWLFFKGIEPGQLQDPGEQLQRVLRFRERCRAEKQVFYKEFDTAEAWARLFRESLSRYVAR